MPLSSRYALLRVCSALDWDVLSETASHRRSEFSALQSYIFLVMLIGFAIFGMGVAIQVKGPRGERHSAS